MATHRNDVQRIGPGQKLTALDWISSWEPPPKYEQWVKFAKQNQCHLGPYRRIEKDLQVDFDSESISSLMSIGLQNGCCIYFSEINFESSEH